MAQSALATSMVSAASSWTESVQATSTQPAAAASSSALDIASAVVPTPPDCRNWLPPCVLPLKWEEMIGQLSQPKQAAQDSAAYDVEWEKPLGQGSFGVVYPGRVRGTEQRVAVKVLSWEKRREAVLELFRVASERRFPRSPGPHDKCVPGTAGIVPHREHGDSEALGRISFPGP